MAHTLRAKTACIGLGMAGMGEAPGKNAMDLMVEATYLAARDAGISVQDIDGVFSATAVHSMPAMSLAEHIGVQPKFSSSSNIGGSSFMAHALNAAMALEAGIINVALIAYGSNQRTAGGFKTVSEPLPYEAVYKPRVPLTAYALTANRYMHEFGATREDLAQIAVAARQWANLNPQAFMQGPLSVEDVLSARMISTPFTKLDCCLVTDGGAAIIMTRAERASDGPHTPVYLMGAAMEHHHRMISEMPDLMHTSAKQSSQRALDMAGFSVNEMDSYQLYDAFTINTMLFLEDIGMCKKGEAKDFIKDGRIAPGGDVAVNTNGGGLSCVHPGMYGMFVMIEAIRQIRAGAGDDEGTRGQGGWLDNAKLSLAHGNGGVLSSQATTIWGHPDTV